MSVQGKIYKKYLFQAKYVIKGKKLKTSTAVVKRKHRMCSNVSIERRETSVVDNIDFELEENTQMSRSRFDMYNKMSTKKSYSESVEQMSAAVSIAEVKQEKVTPVVVNKAEVKKEQVTSVAVNKVEVKKEQVKPVVAYKAEIKKAEVKPVVVNMPEVKKTEASPIIVEVPEIKIMPFNKMESRENVIEVIEARNINMVPTYNEIQNKGTTLIERGQFEEIKTDIQSEMERIRLLELAREKKEKLDQERIEKAREKKEEKLLKEKKLEQQALKEKEKQLQRIEKENQLKEAKKKQRKNESKSFVIVAALLAVIIVAGMANIGKTMYSEIQKDNVLVGDASEEKTDNKKSLFDGLSLFTPADNSSENSTDATESTVDEKEPLNDNVENLDNVEEIIVADSSTKPPTTANPNVGVPNKGTSNKTDLKDYLDNKNTSTNKPADDTFVPPSLGDSDEIETGSGDEEKKEYVEISYSGSNFELYKTANSNITKSTVKAGQCIKYTKYTVDNGVIKIPVADANGIWFIMEGDIIKEKFAYDGDDVAGIAIIVLMKEEDGKEIEDDTIYAKQGSDVKINGTYYTKDDEGEQMNEYTATVKNVVGKMVLYKKTVKGNE